MDVAIMIEEFVALNAKAKSFELTPAELQRWADLKESLISAIARTPMSPGSAPTSRPMRNES
ncbi:MAG: hypothetical protein HY901_08640 [Deltaproteobacteria bacterium]|nr:hypothetical protein [Deltaproteobacteria bacterium]